MNDASTGTVRIAGHTVPLVPVVAALAALALAGLIATSAHAYIFDEWYYIQGAKVLASGASYHTFLTTPLKTPAGPLYATLHWLLMPFTGLQAPAFRWVNFTLLAVLIWALSRTIRLWGMDRPAERALMLLAVPTAWVTSGMALTEIPAVTTIALSVLCVGRAMTAPVAAIARVWGGFAGAGILFGIGILGRQPFLPAVIGFVFIAIFSPAFRWPAALAALLALAVPAPVFAVWGGIVPPDTHYVEGAIKLDYGALGFAYAAMFVLLLAPRYLVTRWKWVLAASAVAAIAVTLGGGLSIEVAAGMARRFPAWLARLFQFGITAVLVGTGAAFIVSSAFNIWERRDDRIFVLLVLLSLGMAATPALVSHQFSSRYLMMTFPFLLLAVQPYFRPTLWAVGRLVAGGAFGFISLQAYLAQPPWPN